MLEKIKQHTPKHITIFSQEECVANSLADYLRRHPEIENKISKNGNSRFLTTESVDKFSEAATLFLGNPVTSEQITLE
jgi:glutamate racemase